MYKWAEAGAVIWQSRTPGALRGHTKYIARILSASLRGYGRECYGSVCLADNLFSSAGVPGPVYSCAGHAAQLLRERLLSLVRRAPHGRVKMLPTPSRATAPPPLGARGRALATRCWTARPAQWCTLPARGSVLCKKL